MSRQILRLKEAQEILKDIHSDLVSTVESGFSDWLKIREFANTFEGGVVNYKARTKAGLIHDHIEKYARTTFSGREGIIADDFKGIFGLNVKDELFIRFKKMDSTYSVRSFYTKQHKKYMKQYPIDGFPEKPTFLFAGYIPDRSWSSIKGIYVACWIGDTLEWVDEFGKYTAEQGVIDFDTNQANIYTQIEKRIKLKKGRKGGTGKTGTDNI
ncbi:MAG: hypothetical protein Q8K66_10400 [Sediminibacterium sp.]|nr:hypothetical protein [Sediminibacterium sp.]MDP3127670.1 hypothetical protein [Sediminibacterium sp.]